MRTNFTPQTKTLFDSLYNGTCSNRSSGGGAKYIHNFDYIISRNNLYKSWSEFLKEKRYKTDVSSFSLNLDFNLRELYFDLKNKTYTHSGYVAFKINDPKPRDIHKATVRDRVLHHLLYKELYPYFDTKFIYDSYSCRLAKGTHKAINRFEYFHRKVSRNYTKQCFILKCDIKKFFANIDHVILKEILTKHIVDTDILNLLFNIIDSFDKGLPLGNLTSQLLVNVYMNEFDQFAKHKLKVKYYIRYADDFVIVGNNRIDLEIILNKIKDFLCKKLKLELHPNKVSIETIYSGVDFLGWVHFPKYKVLRTNTKNRMFRNLKNNAYKEESVTSYKGMLKWGNSYKLKKLIS